jgi:YbbR domain-containing protein
MNWNRLFDNEWFYRLLALVFAISLFNYVNSFGTNDRSQSATVENSNNDSLVSKSSATLKLPLSLNVNSNKYFVSGYPENVKVKISGSSSLVTTATNTRNFSVYADLSGLKPGEHWVKLKQAGLNRDLSYKISPAKIKVKISIRKTASFPVKITYNSGQLANGYQAGKATVSPQMVTVTGAKSDVNKITKIQAALLLTSDTRNTVSRQVTLQAISNSGKILNVVISPGTAKVHLPVYYAESEKKVPVSFVASEGSSNYNYSFSSDTKEVTLKGTRSALAGISKFTVSVPVSNVTSATTKEVDLVLPSKGVSSVYPKTIKVKIEVSSQTASSNSSTKSSADTSNATSSTAASSEQSKGSQDNASTTSSSEKDANNNEANSNSEAETATNGD